MLGRAVGWHWLSLVRDVLALGYRREDIFKSLSVADMAAIVCAAPPGSALRDAFDGGWSKEAQLLANMQEQQAGISELAGPYQRPGQSGWGDEGDDLPQMGKQDAKGYRMFGGKAQSMTWDEAVERDRQRYAAAQAAYDRGYRAKDTRVRTI
jgi:hypothetical protein